MREETFAVQPNRKIFTFCGNKLLRFTKIQFFCGKKLLRFTKIIYKKSMKTPYFKPYSSVIIEIQRKKSSLRGWNFYTFLKAFLTHFVRRLFFGCTMNFRFFLLLNTIFALISSKILHSSREIALISSKNEKKRKKSR